jgi:hypothetical protein
MMSAISDAVPILAAPVMPEVRYKSRIVDSTRRSAASHDPEAILHLHEGSMQGEYP